VVAWSFGERHDPVTRTDELVRFAFTIPCTGKGVLTTLTGTLGTGAAAIGFKRGVRADCAGGDQNGSCGKHHETQQQTDDFLERIHELCPPFQLAHRTLNFSLQRP
jgi:hypothetical protein